MNFWPNKRTVTADITICSTKLGKSQSNQNYWTPKQGTSTAERGWKTYSNPCQIKDFKPKKGTLSADITIAGKRTKRLVVTNKKQSQQRE